MHPVWLLAAVVAVYYVITRLLPQLLSWLLVRRYNLQLSLGKIGLHPLCIYNVCLVRGPVRISADWVNVTSSLFNSQVHRPLALCLHGVLLEQQTPSPGSGWCLNRPLLCPSPRKQTRHALRRVATPLLGQFTGLYLYDLRAICGATEKAEVQAERVTVEGTTTVDNELTVVLRAAALRSVLTRQAATLASFTAELELQTTLVQVRLRSNGPELHAGG